MGPFRKLNCIYNVQKVLVNSILPLASEVGPRTRSVFKEVSPVLSCEGEWLVLTSSTVWSGREDSELGVGVLV